MGSKTGEIEEDGIASNTEKDVILDGELIDAEDIVVPGAIKYTGEIISAHKGFSFIGRVKRGYETVNTNGDVFIPLEFKVGTLVEFVELNDDVDRSKPGIRKFRTESAEEVSDALVPGVKNERAVALRSLTARSTYHVGAKDISQEKIEKAAENMPFAEVYERSDEGKVKDIGDLFKEFLEGTFANLASAGVSYSVKGDIDEVEETEKVENALRAYHDSGMDGQVESVRDEYRSLRGIRDAFALMHANGILSMQTVIPIKHLPDLLVTSPVWFVSSRNSLADKTNENDPQPDHAVKYFCDQVGTKEFAWLYQIYNRRTRPFKQFKGRDIIPLPLLQIMEQAKNVFDYTVIATPYHDIASREWADPAWLRNIDPFLFGFMKNLPYMFLLGRWSETGLFPLMLDMIADTIDHLRINHKKLENFSYNTYWYKGNDGCLGGSATHNSGNNVLVPFAREVIKAYEENRLFEFLRGEKTDAGAVMAQ